MNRIAQHNMPFLLVHFIQLNFEIRVTEENVARIVIVWQIIYFGDLFFFAPN